MRAFVPSQEWPDAIVSILPAGVSSFDIEKLHKIPGVKRISELMPLQLNFDPEEPMEMPGGRGPPEEDSGRVHAATRCFLRRSGCHGSSFSKALGKGPRTRCSAQMPA